MQKLITALFIASFFILSPSSCKKNNGKIPSYIYLDSFLLTTDLASEGYASSDFKDAWVYVDNKLIGVFELPVTVPILKSGKVNLLISPGITENGLNSFRRLIDIYLPLKKEQDLKAGRVDTIILNTSLRANANVAWKEDFEDLSVSLKHSLFNKTNDSIKIIGPNNQLGYPSDEGSKYTGLISMPITDSVRTTEFVTINKFEMPSLGKNVYLEMDIKSNASLQVGIYKIALTGASQRIPYLVINDTKNKWKKIYINFNQEIGNINKTVRERIFFEHTSKANPDIEPTFYIDNLKLIYLQ